MSGASDDSADRQSLDSQRKRLPRCIASWGMWHQPGLSNEDGSLRLVKINENKKMWQLGESRPLAVPWGSL